MSKIRFNMQKMLRYEKSSYEAEMEGMMLLEDYDKNIRDTITDYIGDRKYTNIEVKVDCEISSLENLVFESDKDSLSVLVPIPSKLYGELSGISISRVEQGLNASLRKCFSV